ncbi:MAG: YecH family protein [Candidatus Didemnitutus sp.]|nr:YecH family protein [Candidatus Didemnitutus sp.]
MHPQLTPSVHGHEVMDAMLASGRLFTRDTATDFLTGKFGFGTRYHTCSAEGMTAAELVDFLAARGKFVGTEEGFTVNTHHVCQH